MKIQRSIVVIAALVLVCACTAVAQEKKIKRADLPPAVEKTVAAQNAGATIRGFSQEKENGQMHYEVEMTVDGKSKDIEMDASGTILEVEEQVELDALPAAAKTGLESRAGKGKILKVESIKKGDKLVAYEAKVETNGKKTEIQVGPDGQRVKHE